MSGLSSLALSPSMQRWAVALARAELARAMGVEASAQVEAPEAEVASRPVRGFVSWHLDGRLQGCIGLVESQMPLEDFVRRFAVQAGLHDRRTPDLKPSELERLDFELHLLSEQAPMLDREGKAIRGLTAIASALEPGVDGLWLTHPSGARAFFLPSVWAQLPRAQDFVHALARKAGLDPRGDAVDACEGAVMRAWTHHDRR